MDERYRRILHEATEEPHIDFKRAMGWTRDCECERFEILKHIAAMSTYGGGVLVIGRNDGNKHTGSLTLEQQATFEPTKVNEFARAWLKPLGALRVVPVEYDGSLLALIDVPGFLETPPCFQNASQCRNPAHHGERRHFSRGDVYIRTGASQTSRLSDPEDWRMIWNQITRNIRESVSFGSGDTLDNGNPYELEEDRDVADHRFALPLPDTIAMLDMTVRPVTYIEDRIPRMRLRAVLSEVRFRLTGWRSGRAKVMPYDAGGKIGTFLQGVMLYNQHPEFNQLETVRLRSSGNFRLIRVFPEEFDETGTLRQSQNKLPLIGLSADMTLAWGLAARAAHIFSTSSSELFDVCVSLRGILNREFEDDSTRYGARVPISVIIGSGSPSGERNISIKRRISVAELTQKQRQLAIETYQEILWIFGIEPSTSTVAEFQRAFRDESTPPRGLAELTGD